MDEAVAEGEVAATITHQATAKTNNQINSNLSRSAQQQLPTQSIYSKGSWHAATMLLQNFSTSRLLSPTKKLPKVGCSGKNQHKRSSFPRSWLYAMRCSKHGKPRKQPSRASHYAATTSQTSTSYSTSAKLSVTSRTST